MTSISANPKKILKSSNDSDTNCRRLVVTLETYEQVFLQICKIFNINHKLITVDELANIIKEKMSNLHSEYKSLEMENKTLNARDCELHDRIAELEAELEDLK